MVLEIGCMDKGLATENAGRDGSRRRRVGIAQSELGKRGRQAANRRDTCSLALSDRHHPEGRAAQPHRFFEHRIENRGKLAGRTVDYLEYLGGRRLSFQGFSGLGNEPCILHCDDRLRGKILQQGNLFIAEWSDFLAINCEGTTNPASLRKGTTTKLRTPPSSTPARCNRSPEV